MKVEKANLLC